MPTVGRYQRYEMEMKLDSAKIPKVGLQRGNSCGGASIVSHRPGCSLTASPLLLPAIGRSVRLRQETRPASPIRVQAGLHASLR